MAELHRELKNRIFTKTGYVASSHAIDRFSERCPGVVMMREIEDAIASPKKLTKKRMNVLKRNCPAHAGKKTRFLINSRNVVFVVVDMKIVTTFVFDTK